MRDLETLIVKAVPKLGKGDAKAAKRRAKVARRIGALWNSGPKRVEALGVTVKDHQPVDGDGDALLEAVRAQLGDREFARLLRGVWKQLLKKREAETSKSERLRIAKREAARAKAETQKKATKKKKKKKAPEPAPALTLSSHDDLDEGDELAIPAGELAIPDDALAIPDDELSSPRATTASW